MQRCRECGRPESEVEFKPKANICKPCNIEYMKDYRKRNRTKISQQVQDWKNNNRERYNETNRANYATPEGKKKTLDRVQKTPRVWLAHVLSSIRARCKKPGPHDAKVGPKRVYDIDLDFLVDMYNRQDGKCALSKLPMSHVFNDLRSISVDRVDSELGYVSGNVQLVCKWVNLAKQKHSNEEFLELLGGVCLERMHEAGLDTLVKSEKQKKLPEMVKFMRKRDERELDDELAADQPLAAICLKLDRGLLESDWRFHPISIDYNASLPRGDADVGFFVRYVDFSVDVLALGTVVKIICSTDEYIGDDDRKEPPKRIVDLADPNSVVLILHYVMELIGEKSGTWADIPGIVKYVPDPDDHSDNPNIIPEYDEQLGDIAYADLPQVL